MNGPFNQPKWRQPRSVAHLLLKRLWRQAGVMGLIIFCIPVCGSENKAANLFRKDIQPILVEYCYDCHGDGMKKGNVAFDEFKSDEELLDNRELWWKAL